MANNLDYFTLDDFDSRNFNIYVVNQRGKPLVSNLLIKKESVTESSPFYDGRRFFGTKYGERRIELKCFVTKKITTSQIRYISGWLNQKKTRRLILNHDPYKFYNVMIEGEFNLERYENNGMFSIGFIAYDPFGYSVARSIDTIRYDTGLFYDSGHMYVPVPSMYNSIFAPVTVDVYHGGNTDLATPNIEITGSCTSLSISNISTNESFTYGSANNDVLEFDSRYKNVYRNGIMDNSSFEGDFMRLNGIGESFILSKGEFIPDKTRGINQIHISGTNLNLSTVRFIFHYKYI